VTVATNSDPPLHQAMIDLSMTINCMNDQSATNVHCSANKWPIRFNWRWTNIARQCVSDLSGGGNREGSVA